MLVPFFDFKQIPLGPIILQTWGLLVVLGIVVALIIGRRLAPRFGLNRSHFTDIVAWSVVGGIIGGRLGYAIFYGGRLFLSQPAELFKMWHGGMSIVGGLLGATLVAWLVARMMKVKFLDYADLAALVLPLGLAIGRLGCFFIHDHPGVRFDYLPAVSYAGGGRLDLGLLLALFDALVFVALYFIWRKWSKRPHFLALFILVFSVGRFGLDFLRAWDLPGSDPRLLMLTPTQWLCLLGLALGYWGWTRWQPVATVAVVEEPDELEKPESNNPPADVSLSKK